MHGDDKSFLEQLAENFPTVHRDGQKYIAMAGVAALAGFLLWAPLGWLAAFAAVCLTVVFRDPDRVVPQREGLALAPADGPVAVIEAVVPDPAYGLGDEERLRVTILPALFDVHVQRAPLAGRVAQSIYVPGAFGSVWRDKASDENERRVTVIETSDKQIRIAVVQIAGGLGRRIASFVEDGARIGLGDRVGMVGPGSRVDVYLPVGAIPLVCEGQTMVAGETVLADARSQEPERLARVN
ncbi:MAG: phosphatidylserine decarboxylase [Pseudomonadota bacterium]